MGSKFTNSGDSRSFRTVKRPATGTALVQGDPVLVGTGIGQIFGYAFDTYSTVEEQVIVFFGDSLRVEAQAVNSQIASVNFNVMDFLFWDVAAQKITNVSGPILMGRALEAKNFSAGVAIGDTLKFMTVLPI